MDQNYLVRNFATLEPILFILSDRHDHKYVAFSSFTILLGVRVKYFFYFALFTSPLKEESKIILKMNISLHFLSLNIFLTSFPYR